MRLGIRPLPLVIVLMAALAGSKTIGLVQALGIASPARANASEHAPAAKPAAEAKPRPPQAAVAPPPATDPPISEAERAALQDLRARRKELDGRVAALDEREALLTAAERRLTDRIQQLAALQSKLEQLEQARHDREEASWRGLVKTYETMRPRDAAVIFNDLDAPVLLQVLDRMKEAKAAPILAAMIPERARTVTAQLAQYRTKSNAAPRLDAPEGGRKE